MSKAIETAVIVGRVNVGKSTLFNALTNSDEAVISPHPGTTCDRKYGLIEENGQLFRLVDTGGVNLRSLEDSIFALAPRRTKIEILSEFKGMLERAMLRQIKVALKEADLLLVVVDGEQGIHPEDKDLASVLSHINKPKILVCNKSDKMNPTYGTEVFRKLRLGRPIPVSAVSRSGIGTLLQSITSTLEVDLVRSSPDVHRDATSNGTDALFRIVMMGRSGVGKSSLFNQIMGEELAVVSDVYQTTIDSNKGQLIHRGKSILMTDTPGLMTKSEVKGDLDEIIQEKTLEVLKDANAVLFVTDVMKSLCSADQHLAQVVARTKLPTVIVANKWDTFPRKDEEMIDQIMLHYRSYLSRLASTPVMLASAKTGQGVKKVLDLAINHSTN